MPETIKDFAEMMRDEDATLWEAHQARVASGEDAREREAFRIRSEAEHARMVAHGCIETDEERAEYADDEDEDQELESDN